MILIWLIVYILLLRIKANYNSGFLNILWKKNVQNVEELLNANLLIFICAGVTK